MVAVALLLVVSAARRREQRLQYVESSADARLRQQRCCKTCVVTSVLQSNTPAYAADVLAYFVEIERHAWLRTCYGPWLATPAVWRFLRAVRRRGQKRHCPKFDACSRDPRTLASRETLAYRRGRPSPRRPAAATVVRTRVSSLHRHMALNPVNRAARRPRLQQPHLHSIFTPQHNTEAVTSTTFPAAAAIERWPRARKYL